MTNNNWIEEFYKKFTDGVDAKNGYYDSQFTEGRPCNVESFISNLLTKKDQEHKAELERIKGELIDCSFTVLNGYSGIEVVKDKDIKAILDSHINKLSTE